MRAFLIMLGAAALAGCAFERAQIADDARARMVGMSKQQVLACMGPPTSRMAEAEIEVWSYRSTNGHIDVSSSSQAMGHTATGSAVATSRFCDVQVVLRGGRVERLNYAGPTGGLLTEGEQCAYAVTNCVPRRIALPK
jgi:hypothetical protein